jgi:hypothetical protein
MKIFLNLNQKKKILNRYFLLIFLSYSLLDLRHFFYFIKITLYVNELNVILVELH